ncbi:MAG TPA: DUF2752 domain-containing protein [Cyclobacteriaceae bacterium]|nr:DUF2752 domain-containing protein [Cyclobacteriaceae bacterium]
MVFAAGLGFLYWKFNPADTTNYFPACPFRTLTGHLCPGCGSQRAVHDLLHLHVANAFMLNPLLVISLPYVALGFVFENIPMNDARLALRKKLYGPVAIQVVLVVVIVFWVGRNIL